MTQDISCFLCPSPAGILGGVFKLSSSLCVFVCLGSVGLTADQRASTSATPQRRGKLRTQGNTPQTSTRADPGFTYDFAAKAIFHDGEFFLADDFFHKWLEYPLSMLKIIEFCKKITESEQYLMCAMYPS